MKRRQFFKMLGKTGLGLGLMLVGTAPSTRQNEAQSDPVMGVDVAAEGVDTTLVSLHPINAASPDNLGGFLVPQEYTDEVLRAMKGDSTFRGTGRTVSWRSDPSTVALPANPNLLVDNFKWVHQDFAQFLKEGAA